MRKRIKVQNSSTTLRPVLIIYFLLLQSIASTVAFLPFSLGGIGLQESAIVGILRLSGIDVTIALAFSLLVRGMSMLVDAVPGMVHLRKLSPGEI